MNYGNFVKFAALGFIMNAQMASSQVYPERFDVTKIEGHQIIASSSTSLKTFSFSDNHVRTYDLRGRLLADKLVAGPMWLTAAPKPVLESKWLSGSMVFDSEYNLEQSLFQNADGTNKVCADGYVLKIAEDQYTYDLSERNNQYVLTSKQGLTFFDRQWNCLKRVKISSWKPGGNGSYRFTGRAPEQLTGQNDLLYMVDDYVHYLFDANGTLLFVGQLGERGLVAQDVNSRLRYGIELSMPQRMSDGSLLVFRSQDNFLVAQSISRDGQFRQPVVIRGPFINTSYRLNVQREVDQSVTVTYSEWVLRFNANGQYLGSRRFNSPVAKAGINQNSQVLVKLMTENNGGGNFSEPFVMHDASLNPLFDFSINTLFSDSNIASWGANYLVGSYSETIGSADTHYLTVVDAASRASRNLGIRVPSACAGEFCQVQSLETEIVQLGVGTQLVVFKSYPNHSRFLEEAVLYLAVF